MKAGAEVNQPFRFANQDCNNVRRQSVDRENLRQSIFCLQALRFLISNRCVVNHSVHGAQFVNLLCDGFRLCDARQIADDNRLGTGDFGPQLVRAILVSRMQHYFVSLIEKQSPRHQAKPIG